MSERRPGFYWVRPNHNYPHEWVVAEWSGYTWDVPCWIGQQWGDSDLNHIDERRLEYDGGQSCLKAETRE